MTKITVRIEEPRRVDDMLGQLDLELRLNTLKRGLTAAAKIVQRDAKRRVPRSSDTGTRRKWSKALREERAGVKPHAETVSHVVRSYANATIVAVIGAAYPAGALSHLIQEGHRAVLWGRRTGAFIPGKRYLAPAADSTRSQQQQAIISTIERAIARSKT